MKKIPLITLLSFFILIPYINAEETDDGYKYNETTKTVSNNYYFFLEPSNDNDLNIRSNSQTTNYTLFTKFDQTWLKVAPSEIELNNTCKKTSLEESLYDGSEDCWSYRRYYYIMDKIDKEGAIKKIKANTSSSLYSKELVSGTNHYYSNAGYKTRLDDNEWLGGITCEDGVQDDGITCNGSPTGELTKFTDSDSINIGTYRYKTLACSSISTKNTVCLVDEETGDPIDENTEIGNRNTIIEIERKYEEYTISNVKVSKNNSTKCNGIYKTGLGTNDEAKPFQNNVVYSPVLYNIKLTDNQKTCDSSISEIKGTCNNSSTSSDLKCLKTIINGNSKAEIKLDQNATITNILTPNEIYQGGGIKLGFIYYNTVKWSFAAGKRYGSDAEIIANIKNKLKDPVSITEDIKTNISFKDKNGNEYKINNIQTSCQQEGNFNEGETVTTICTILLPEAEVELGTGKVNYKNSEGKGINNEYYTPIKYTDNLSLEATIENIGVLNEVDGWTDNWTLTYDGKEDKTCQVNVTSRLYKPEKNNEYAFIYRPIDLNNPFPNRNAGVNWYDWYSVPYNKNRLKLSYDKKEYTAELDNQVVSKIKEYNKNNNNNYLDWRGISETGKSEFIETNDFMTTYGGGTP